MNKKSSFWCSKSGVAALLMIAVAGYFLLVEHGEHIFPYLPFIILLMCPLMHLFMHGNHKHGGHKHHESPIAESSVSKGLDSENFADQSKQNDAYREGYIEGLKTAREENVQQEQKHEQ